ncbi:hypothetical protein AHAS_Ahas14G0132200 [Arachis hypogaea]
MVVVPCMVHMAHKVVGMVDMGWGHMVVFGEKGLVSKDESYTHKNPEVVVAKKVDQSLEALPIFDYSILDAYPHCSSHSLQHNLSQTHSQRGENS